MRKRKYEQVITNHKRTMYYRNSNDFIQVLKERKFVDSAV